jgi:hypothetical protein
VDCRLRCLSASDLAQPELLSGSLRQNLDPFGRHDDATLNDALRSAGLFSLQAHATEEASAPLGLDSTVSSGGGNLSVGQRQIIALARALVRQSKLLILDEATSAIDYETDTIQTSLRRELAGDMTVVVIAHRLQTIMDSDKIVRCPALMDELCIRLLTGCCYSWSWTPAGSWSSTPRTICSRTRRASSVRWWTRAGTRMTCMRRPQKLPVETGRSRFQICDLFEKSIEK